MENEKAAPTIKSDDERRAWESAFDAAIRATGCTTDTAEAWAADVSRAARLVADAKVASLRARTAEPVAPPVESSDHLVGAGKMIGDGRSPGVEPSDADVRQVTARVLARPEWGVVDERAAREAVGVVVAEYQRILAERAPAGEVARLREELRKARERECDLGCDAAVADRDRYTDVLTEAAAAAAAAGCTINGIAALKAERDRLKARLVELEAARASAPPEFIWGDCSYPIRIAAPPVASTPSERERRLAEALRAHLLDPDERTADYICHCCQQTADTAESIQHLDGCWYVKARALLADVQAGDALTGTLAAVPDLDTPNRRHMEKLVFTATRCAVVDLQLTLSTTDIDPRITKIVAAIEEDEVRVANAITKACGAAHSEAERAHWSEVAEFRCMAPIGPEQTAGAGPVMCGNPAARVIPVCAECLTIAEATRASASPVAETDSGSPRRG